jgi:hypothetical protein
MTRTAISSAVNIVATIVVIDIWWNNCNSTSAKVVNRYNIFFFLSLQFEVGVFQNYFEITVGADFKKFNDIII